MDLAFLINKIELPFNLSIYINMRWHFISIPYIKIIIYYLLSYLSINFITKFYKINNIFKVPPRSI